MCIPKCHLFWGLFHGAISALFAALLTFDGGLPRMLGLLLVAVLGLGTLGSRWLLEGGAAALRTAALLADDERFRNRNGRWE